MLNDYYDCPADLRKPLWKIVLEALGKIAVTAMLIAITIALYKVFN